MAIVMATGVGSGPRGPGGQPGNRDSPPLYTCGRQNPTFKSPPGALGLIILPKPHAMGTRLVATTFTPLISSEGGHN